MEEFRNRAKSSIARLNCSADIAPSREFAYGDIGLEERLRWRVSTVRKKMKAAIKTKARSIDDSFRLAIQKVTGQSSGLLLSYRQNSWEVKVDSEQRVIWDRPNMPSPKNRYEALIIVMSVTVIVGMAIAVFLLYLGREHPSAVAGGAGLNAAITVCPPFMLVYIAREMEDTALSRLIIYGAVVIGNGSLYAGLAMFVMWVRSRVWPRRRV
jgi:hypothetical protein